MFATMKVNEVAYPDAIGSLDTVSEVACGDTRTEAVHEATCDTVQREERSSGVLFPEIPDELDIPLLRSGVTEAAKAGI